MGKIISVLAGKGGTGKSVTAINLANAFHQLGKDVLLVDGDLSSPNIHNLFGLENPSPNINQVLNNKIHYTEAIHSSKNGFLVLPGSHLGVRGKNANFSSLMDDLRYFSDYVVVDSGPVYSNEFFSTLGACDDAIIVSDQDSISHAISLYDFTKEHGIDARGILLNKGGRAELNAPVIMRIPKHKSLNKAHPSNHSKISKQFSDLAKSLL